MSIKYRMNARAARNNFRHLLDRAYAEGAGTVITRNGVAVAALVPLRDVAGGIPDEDTQVTTRASLSTETPGR